MPDHDPVTVVRRCFAAYADSDRAALEAMLAEDFHFTSPLDNRLDRAAYLERCWPANETIAGYDFVRLLANGDEVVATYVAHLTGGRTFRNTEVLTVRAGRIVAVEVYFGWNLPHDAPPGEYVTPGSP